LIAGLVAIAVAFYTKNVLATMGLGMVVLWILQAVSG
jgi:branched-subunit amino acid transport protein